MSGKHKGWRKRWLLTGDGYPVATHTTGLIVNFDAGGRAHIDAETIPPAEAAISAEGVAERHLAAEIYRLVAEATRFRIERLEAQATRH